MNKHLNWILLAILGPLLSAGMIPAEMVDDTMLMFVGEDLTVMTVASRRPESPETAPAIARVVHREEILRHGYQTLAELLAAEPGFYIATPARGSIPFLRGIPDGILLLYDGVPLNMDLTKTLHPLDRELSLHGIQQVEIVRGPGSVLWGSDAFAGVVNLVPLSGRNQPGVQIHAFGGSWNVRGARATWGQDAGHWHSLLAVSAAQETPYNNEYPVIQRISNQPPTTLNHKLDPSHYLEMTGNARFGDWLSLSGRLTDFRRRYKLQDVGTLSWPGQRQAPINYLKASASHLAGPSHWVLTGYYQHIRYSVTDVDLSRSQENNLFYTELLWDRRLWHKGLLTAGGSWRLNRVKGAFVSDNFLPEYLKPENTIFVPRVEQTDYENRIGSVFMQYRHHFRHLDAWVGGRVDDHSQYHTSASYSLGLNWPLSNTWRLKTAFGTAYRSPYSSQLFGGSAFDSERVSTLTLQLAWEPSPRQHIALTGFYSRLSDHIQEDPYGGLSQPSSQSITGAELEARVELLPELTLFGNLTALNAWGPPEKYRAFKYAFLRPDGTRVDVYDTWETPFNTGPGLMARLGSIWRPNPDVTITLEASKTAKVPYRYAQNSVSGYYHQPLLANLTLRFQNIIAEHTEIIIRGRNLLDQRYQVPGMYGPEPGIPFTALIELGYGF